MTTPLMLLHPLGVDHRFWEPVVRALPDVLGEPVVPDLPGHGSAPLPARDATVEDFADAVEELLAGHGPVHLVGVSLGGIVAQVLAARRPDLVRRLVVADAVAVYPEAMRAMWRDRAETVRRDGLAAAVEPMEALWFSEAFRRDAAETVARVRRMVLAGDPEGYARTCEALAVADTTDRVGSIVAPTLVTCGADDAPPFRLAAEWFAATLPEATLGWLPGRHATAYEHPRSFAEAVAAFLR
ncbi:3-oxoadipate enol-lactonase [Plantactinospora mayteni]|uniref:3-oxoadipate enol-lactonase n=1 Tax=Plantactinospora mayteni TaxID=566021 RepID=A0ABQ4F1I0_9ACTN|nr:alpha/beta fold hydrolase [Plantactinospora mayteni]GIH00722.1 3-oxoadipate enol-lactonase [Plantactinospora mayteni]